MAKIANPFKSSKWRVRSNLFVVMGVFLSVITLHNMFVFTERDKIKTIADNRNNSLPMSFTSGGVRAHIETIDGGRVLWASPREQDLKTIGGNGEIKGLLLLAHGCGHSNIDWFAQKSPECEDCIGLPEEMAIVEMALSLGLVPIAMSASNFRTKCWSGFDVTPVGLVLKEFWHRFSNAEANTTTVAITTNDTQQNRRILLQQNLPQQLQVQGAFSSEVHSNDPITNPLPIYAFGASSGGAFVSSLAKPLMSRFGIRLDGFVSQISAKLPTKRQIPYNTCKVYITMNKDIRTDKDAQSMVEKCGTAGNNINVHNDRCLQFRLPPLPIKPSYFADRIPGVSKTESYEMVKVLTQAKILDPKTGMLYEDPRKTHKQWSAALLSAAKLPVLAFLERADNLIPDKSPISEVLNVAWGLHEMSRDGVREALAFCLEPQ